MSDFELDTGLLQRALQEYGRETKKDEADILNRAGRNIALRSVQFTPKADKAAIRALDPKIIAGAVAKKLRTSGVRLGGAISQGIMRNERGHFVKGSGAKVRAAGGITGADFRLEVKKEFARRVRSVGYVAAGWIKAAQAFGGAMGRKVSPKGNAAKSSGKPATVQTLVAELTNAANGADIVGKEALQEAVDFAAKDMLTYAYNKMADTATKHSAR